MKYLLFFISLAAFAQVPRPGAWQTPAGGAIGGASSVATGQVLFGTSAGVAGSEANFTYGVNGLFLGASSAKNSQVNGTIRSTGNFTTGFTGPGVELDHSGGNGYVTSYNRTSLAWLPLQLRGSLLQFIRDGVEVARFAATTGNLLLGTTTDDGSNRLQVAGSALIGGTVANNVLSMTRTGGNPSTLSVGAYTDKPAVVFSGASPLSFEVNGGSSLMTLSTAGALQLYNQTPTTGVTQFIVRAGAGQGVQPLTTWQTSAGTAVGRVAELGLFWRGSAAADKFQMYADGSANALFMASDAGLSWKSSTDVEGGAGGLALRRDSATALAIMDSPTGVGFRDIKMRAVESTGYAFASLPAATNGTFLYCSDCTIASPCASGGTGALAKRLNSTWVCN